MPLNLYNSLTRKLELFQPIEPKEVKMYVCGPTVYNYVHIGNLRAYITADVLRKYLEFSGYQILHVMNLTDVDDKTINRAKEEGKPLSEVTTFYTDAFVKDITAIGINLPEKLVKATDEIAQMVELIEKLLKTGHAYRSPKGDVYFRINSDPKYGELANISQQKLRENADGRLNLSDNYEKESINDFALWKAWDADDGVVYWESSLGKGRPGWHIECSAMSMKYLGETFDIHCGGIDLLFPHHTNEIAQSESATGKKFVNYWVHNAHLMVNGRKMSKSLGNFYILKDLTNKGYSTKAIRYELLKTHYRAELDFRDESFIQNDQVIKKFKDFILSIKSTPVGTGVGAELTQITASIQIDFITAMDDDLNVPLAFKAIHEGISKINKVVTDLNANEKEIVLNLFKRIDHVFSLFTWEEEQISSDIEKLIQEREAARKNKDFKRADEIRNNLLKEGIELLDSAQGTSWRRR